jgi:exonuclease III
VRWLEIYLPDSGFALGALHIPTASAPRGQRRGESKTRFWDAVLLAAADRIDEPFLFVGDLNTGQHRIDEPGCTFVCADRFERLAASGWTDAWRHFNGAAFEPTWISSAGTPYRLDHAFVSPALLPRLTACRYSHAEREAGVSDHSALVVEIA